MNPIPYGELVHELNKLYEKWLQGGDIEHYDDFKMGMDEGSFQCAIELRKLLVQTGFLEEYNE